MERHTTAWLVGGVFAIISSLLSFLLMRQHTIYNPAPKLRKYVLRILFMVPIYALESWLGLRFKDAAMYFDLMRECYEALVIYSFYCFLVEFLGGEERLVALMVQKKPRKHFIPFRFCCPLWEMGPDFFVKTKVGTLQYTVVRLVCSIITFITSASGCYHEGHMRMNDAYPYMAFAVNCSQAWAMYCLIFFYFNTKHELKPIKPVPKFLCVKAVVFFTFWQGVLLALLVNFGLITSTRTYDKEDIVTGLQDFIVCIEMLFAAIAHSIAFDYKDFQTLDVEGRMHLINKRAAPLMATLFDAVNVTDVYLKDVPQMVRLHRASYKPMGSNMGPPDREEQKESHSEQRPQQSPPQHPEPSHVPDPSVATSVEQEHV